MAWNSSTSSFELTPEEWVRPGRVPVAAIVFVGLVALIEIAASVNHDWFANAPSSQWESKRTLFDAGELDGDVEVFGTSVLFFGLDPTVANQAPGSGRAVNLALVGMTLQHQTQLFRERVAAAKPRVAVLEFREVIVTQDSWISGPYFRFWARWTDFLESRFFYWDLPVALGFFENRVSTIYRHRVAVRNWILQSALAGGPVRHTRDRNRAILPEMRAHAGWVKPVVEDSTIESSGKLGRPRLWAVNPAGERWLKKFLDTAAANKVQVVLMLTPALPPPHVVEMPGPDGFRARFNDHVARLRQAYPGIGLEVFEPAGFALEDFGDDIHMSSKGRAKLSGAFAVWLSDYRLRHGVGR